MKEVVHHALLRKETMKKGCLLYENETSKVRCEKVTIAISFYKSYYTSHYNKTQYCTTFCYQSYFFSYSSFLEEAK